MPNVMKIRYADATIKQLAKARCKRPEATISGGNTYEKMLATLKQKDKVETYRSYDRYGRLTLVGKARRLQDLIDNKLNENTTVQDFLAKMHENMMNCFSKTLVKIERASKAKERRMQK